MKRQIFVLLTVLTFITWYVLPVEAGWSPFRRKIKDAPASPLPPPAKVKAPVSPPKPAPIAIKSGGGTNSTVMCVIDTDRNVQIAPGVTANQVILRMTEIVQDQQTLMASTLSQIRQRDQVLIRTLRELTAIYAGASPKARSAWPPTAKPKPINK